MTVEEYLQRAAECVRLAAGTTFKPIKRALEDTAALGRKQAAVASQGGSAHDRYVMRAIDDAEEMSTESWGQANDNRPS